MALSWSQTPDLCLLAIFKHIPLSDLILNVTLVCTNWSRLQWDESKRRRTQTKALVLIQNYPRHLKLLQQRENSFGSELIEHVRREDGSPWSRMRSLDQIRFDTLLVPGDGVLSQTFFSPLMNILADSNITQLTLVKRNLNGLSSIFALVQMNRLINHFSASLVSLKVDLYFLNSSYCSSRNIALFNSINQLTSLRHLTLNGNFPDLRQLSLPILSRLATFSTNRFEPTRVLVSSFREIPTAATVRIDCDIQLGLHDLHGFSPELAAKFTRIRVKVRLRVYENVCVNMRLLGIRFVMLTCLELIIDTMPMTVIAQCLTQQTELIHLKLNFDIPEPDERHPRPQISQIPSVRLLTLSFYTRSHLDTELLRVPEIFPNLQVLHLSLYTRQCTACRFDVTNFNQLLNDPELRPRIEHCMRLTREPFRSCANLSTIKFDLFGQLQSIRPQGLITVDQL